MSNQFDNVLQDFVNNWNGPYVSIASAGVGSSLAQLLDIPGSSKIINSNYNFNDTHNMINFMKKSYEYSNDQSIYHNTIESLRKKGSCVNKNVAFLLSKSLIIGKEYHDNMFLGITGALTTNRYRKGKNKAFICLIIKSQIRPHKQITLEFPKLTEEEWNNSTYNDLYERRVLESQAIACASLHLMACTSLHIISNINSLITVFEDKLNGKIIKEDS